MKTLLVTIFVGISLSMDAFSLSLIYGTLNLSKSQKYLLSFIIGLFHFFMPVIGLMAGAYFMNKIPINLNYLVTFIFAIIGINLIVSSHKQEEPIMITSIFSFLILGFSVSIDSFSTGIGLSIVNSNFLQVALIFAIISASFTYIGLYLGNRITKKLGSTANIIGGILLLILAFFYLIK